MRSRLSVIAGLIAASLGCDAARPTPRAFPDTAFLDLAEVGVADGGLDHALAGDGRFLLVQHDGLTQVHDLLQGQFGRPVDVRIGGAGLEVAGEHVVLFKGVGGVDVLRLAAEPVALDAVVSSTIPATDGFLGEERVVLWDGARLWVLDREVFFTTSTTPDDALLTMEIGLLKAAAVRGDVLWTTSDGMGHRGWDISDLAAPVELYALGDWFAYELLVVGDLLFLAHGYNGGAYDVSDPREPVALGQLYAGEGMAVYDGHYYGVAGGGLTILALDGVAPPVPVRWLAVAEDASDYADDYGYCSDVVAGPHGVFPVCDGAVHWFAPNTP